MAEHRSEERGGEALLRGVVGLHGLVETAALDGDAVLGALELGLEVTEIGGGLQVGIALGDDEEAGEGAAELALGFFKRGEGGGVGRRAGGGQLHAADGGAGGDDLGEGGLLEVGGAGDGVDEVGDQVGAALVHVLHLRPRGVGALLEGDEAVEDAADPEAEDDRQQHEEPDDDQEDFANAHG